MFPTSKFLAIARSRRKLAAFHPETIFNHRLTPGSAWDSALNAGTTAPAGTVVSAHKEIT
jgi:hypothetical protein